MAYIYKIENKINGKVYIGKTLKNPQERWREHILDSHKTEESARPLYRAFNKYGVDNFMLTTIEECSDLVVNDREVFWIEAYGSFKYGYNATLGGDGKHYCDYDLIYTLFEEGKSINEISRITHYDVETCRKALNNRGITKEARARRGREKIMHPVFQLDKDTEEVIGIYSSIQEAYNALGKRHSGHIAGVCNGKRKTAYGFKWRYQN